MSILTKEVIQKILNDDWLLMDDCEGLENCTVIKELSRMALAAMDSEPVAWTDEEELRDVERSGCGYLFTVNPVTPHADERRIILLYRHAQPARETEREPIAWLNDAYLARGVVDGEAGSEDAGPGYIPVYREAGPQLAPVVMDDIKLRELFDSWFASDCSFDLSPQASEADNIAWRESYWYVWQRCRAAMLQAGNSPVIPDGYVMVPKEPTEEMNKAGWSAMNEHDAINPTYRAMLAAAPAGIPMNSTKWIPVSERMPETDGNYWGWWSESKRQGPVWFIKSELQAQFQSHEITHWMPLPAAPQEVKGE